MSGAGGRLAIVLHSHSPWLLGYGTWPVGEEWLRQAWGQAYLPLVQLLRARAEQVVDRHARRREQGCSQMRHVV